MSFSMEDTSPFDFNDILGMLRRGMSSDEIAQRFTNNLNNAIDAIEAEENKQKKQKYFDDRCGEIASSLSMAYLAWCDLNGLQPDRKVVSVSKDDIAKLFDDYGTFLKAVDKLNDTGLFNAIDAHWVQDLLS